MAKIKTLTLGGSYTYSPEAYHSERAELTLTAELEDGDDADAVAEELRQQISLNIALTLAHMDDEIHQPLMKGSDIEGVAKEMIANINDDMFEAVDPKEDTDGW